MSKPGAATLAHTVSRPALTAALSSIATDTPGEISFDKLKQLLCSSGAGLAAEGANSIMTDLVRLNYSKSTVSIEDIVALLVPSSQVASFDELNATESAAITRKFASIDTDGDGSIQTEDLELLTARLGTGGASGLTSLQRAQVAARVEDQGDGRVGVSEFFNILRDVDRPTGPPTAKLLDRCFAAFDKDKTGSLTPGRMREVVDILGGAGAAKSLAGMIEKSVRSDGLINYHKFIAVYTSRIQLKV